MKKGGILAAAALSLCMVLHSAGCSKDAVLDGYNRMLQHWGKYALTGAGDLTGVKTPGEDSYTGSYTAAYDCFSDTELLFGGTALDRTAGNVLTVRCSLTVEQGHASVLVYSGSEEPTVLLSETGDYDGNHRDRGKKRLCGHHRRKFLRRRRHPVRNGFTRGGRTSFHNINPRTQSALSSCFGPQPGATQPSLFPSTLVADLF